MGTIPLLTPKQLALGALLYEANTAWEENNKDNFRNRQRAVQFQTSERDLDTRELHIE
jgi:hypothetical protein